MRRATPCFKVLIDFNHRLININDTLILIVPYGTKISVLIFINTLILEIKNQILVPYSLG